MSLSSSSDLPSEVIAILLSYLGKIDLLNARFVCRSWNEETVRVLRKSRFNQTLSESRIEDYVKFVRESSTPRFILHFHLNFTLTLHKSKYQVITRVPLKTLTKCVDSLCRIFGSDCVSGLSLKTDDITCSNAVKFIELGLTKLFHLISSGLTELDLTGFKVQLKIDDTQMDILTSRTPTFPNLRKMTCTPYDNFSLGGPQARRGILTSSTAQILIPIVQNSPNLVDMRIIHGSCDLRAWPLKFDKLVTLAVDIAPDSSVLLDRFRQCNSTHVLRELHLLNYKGREQYVGDDLILHNLLALVSTTLKTLKVQTIPRDRVLGLPFPKFPSLPYLENLELVDGARSGHFGLRFIYHEDINFNAETLPSLKAVNFPIGIIFTSNNDLPPPMQYINVGIGVGIEMPIYQENADVGVEFPRDQDVRVEFPSVNKLAVRINHHVSFLQRYGDGAMKHLFKLFPNASSICIVNGSPAPNYYSTNNRNDPQHTVKLLLDQMIHAEWSNQIHEIRLNGFNQDYLGQVMNKLDHPPSIILHNCNGESVLEETIKNAFQSSMGTMHLTQSSNGLGGSIIFLQEENQHASHKMTNIKRVRLEFEEDTTNMAMFGMIALRPMPVPNLTMMAKHFPTLRTIQISPDLFPRKNHNGRRGQIQEFISAFPGVVVEIN